MSDDVMARLRDAERDRGRDADPMRAAREAFDRATREAAK